MFKIMRNDKILHSTIPSLPDAKAVLQDMERAALGAGEIVESYALAFRAAGVVYRIE